MELTREDRPVAEKLPQLAAERGIHIAGGKMQQTLPRPMYGRCPRNVGFRPENTPNPRSRVSR